MMVSFTHAPCLLKLCIPPSNGIVRWRFFTEFGCGIARWTIVTDRHSWNVSTQNAFSLPLAAILVNRAPSGEMHNYCTPHIIKENFWEFLDPSVQLHILLSQVYCVWQFVKHRQSFWITLYVIGKLTEWDKFSEVLRCLLGPKYVALFHVYWNQMTPKMEGYKTVTHMMVNFNLLATDFFFQILAHPVFKMRVIQKPNKVALRNKRHFEEKKWRLYSMFKTVSTDICWINMKWGIYI